MSAQESLSDLFNCDYYPKSVTTFAEHLPQQWLVEATNKANQATVRRRKLPSENVLWLVIGMALFRNEPVSEVVRRMGIALGHDGEESLLAKSALTQARQRLGSEAVQWLFRHSAAQWGLERYSEDDWHGLQVFAMDGALLRTADTPELRDHFGSGNTSTERQTPFPMLRVVALMNTRSHIMVDAHISPYRRGEIPLARNMTDKLPDNSVTLLDKGFFSAQLLMDINRAGQNRHWLLPMRKGLRHEVIEDDGEGDQLWEMPVSPQARKQDPALPEYWQVRAVTYSLGNSAKTVLTSLPKDHYSAEQVATLYHERWQIELSFRHIKSGMQHNVITLRSKTVELVYQELWGLLLAYNLIKREASLAAISHGRRPDEVSFKFACQYIAAELINMAVAVSPGNTAKRLKNLRGNIALLYIEKRPRPSRPRAVKISKTRYPVNRYAAPLK